MASACARFRGNPSNSQPSLQSASCSLFRIIGIVISSGTSSPLSIYPFAFCPSSVPFEIFSLSLLQFTTDLNSQCPVETVGEYGLLTASGVFHLDRYLLAVVKKGRVLGPVALIAEVVLLLLIAGYEVENVKQRLCQMSV